MNELALEGTVTCFYYRDYMAALKFYTEKVGLELVADFGYSKILKIAENATLCVVDGNKSTIKPADQKPCRVVITVKNIDAWAKHLEAVGVKLDHPGIYEGKLMKLRSVSFLDPEGYKVEFCQYLTPYGK